MLAFSESKQNAHYGAETKVIFFWFKYERISKKGYEVLSLSVVLKYVAWLRDA